MKRIIFSILIFASAILCLGQEQKQYNHLIGMQGVLNPAYNGTQQCLVANFLNRNQWVGLEGAPITQSLNVHMPISFTNVGAGITFEHESIGAHHAFSFFAAASYQIDLPYKMKLSLGLQLGLNAISLDNSKLEVQDNADAALVDFSDVIFNAGFGAYLYAPTFFAGFSIPELCKSLYDAKTYEYTNSFSAKNMHYYLYGGYLFNINNNFSIKPTLLMRIVYGAPLQFDIGAHFLIYNYVWAGLEYKTSNEIVIVLEYMINRYISVRYSFDYPFSDLNSAQKAGSHEVGVGVNVDIYKKMVKSIRYF